MANCTKCGSAMLPGAAFCTACGTPVAAAPSPSATPSPSASSPAASGGLPSNVAGALAYLTIIPAIVFLVIEPFNRDRFVRFHSFQCLFLAGALVVLQIGLVILSIILNFIPVVGTIVAILLWPIVILCILGLIAFLAYKAYNEEKFMLPFIGNLAEQQAAK